MASLVASVNKMEEYLTQKASDTARLVSAKTSSDKGDPLGQSALNIENKTIQNAKNAIGTNPIVQMGIDTATQYVTTVGQQVVGDALRKINLSPIQNATQNFFQAWATISTFEAEVAMELARNTARNAVGLIEQKRTVIQQLQTELTALHNAAVILLNSSPFIDAYLNQLIEAYGILRRADQKFASVVRTLTNSSRLRQREFDSGVADLEAAQRLILPDRGADVSSIRGATDLLSETISRQTNQQAIAAALSIPSISLRVGQLVLDYVRLTVEINLLLNTFLDALDGFITSFSRNDNIDQVTIDHITAGRTQLGTLLQDMSAILFPDDVMTVNLDPTRASFGVKLSASATSWGLRLQAIIEWMKLNPGKGSATLDRTSNTVRTYEIVCAAIRGFGSVSYTGGQVDIEQSREDTTGAIRQVAQTMLLVNTIVATQRSRASVNQRFRTTKRHFEAADFHLNRLSQSLNQFIATRSNLSGPAQQVINQALGIANKYGLDRVAGLLSDGRVRELFDLSPDEMTYAGSAVVGINELLAEIRSNPNATDAQVEQLEAVRDAVERERVTKDIEASRSFSSAIADAQAALKEKFLEIKRLITPAKEAAAALDPSVLQQQNRQAEDQMSRSIPGFSANRELIG